MSILFRAVPDLRLSSILKNLKLHFTCPVDQEFSADFILLECMSISSNFYIVVYATKYTSKQKRKNELN